ncbi:MAG: acyl carrier protein [Pirellulaceae bacterium]|nr:acyl carrier protein [Pirellulaceae bacterium]
MSRGSVKEGPSVPSIEESLISQFAEKFGSRPELTDSLVLLGIDSVGMAEWTYEIEQAYKIKVDDELLHVETIQELADYIRQRQSV